MFTTISRKQDATIFLKGGGGVSGESKIENTG